MRVLHSVRAVQNYLHQPSPNFAFLSSKDQDLPAYLQIGSLWNWNDFLILNHYHVYYYILDWSFKKHGNISLTKPQSGKVLNTQDSFPHCMTNIISSSILMDYQYRLLIKYLVGIWSKSEFNWEENAKFWTVAACLIMYLLIYLLENPILHVIS